MKGIIQQIAQKNRERESEEAKARQAEIDSPPTHDNRRNFLKKTALGGMALTSLMGLSLKIPRLRLLQKFKKLSAPSRFENNRHALLLNCCNGWNSDHSH